MGSNAKSGAVILDPATTFNFDSSITEVFLTELHFLPLLRNQAIKSDIKQNETQLSVGSVQASQSDFFLRE